MHDNGHNLNVNRWFYVHNRYFAFVDQFYPEDLTITAMTS